MKRVLYIHVGMDKTGTSAIQLFLNNNREILYKNEDLYYAKSGLWQDYSHHPFAFSILNMNGYTNNYFDDLLEQFAKETVDKNRVLISSECLFKVTENKNFNDFYKFINDKFDNIKVIVYIRRQDLWVESRYKHSILSGSNMKLDMLQEPRFCNYKQFIDKWAKVVGANNVIVKIYEKDQFVNNNIFCDFLSIFNIDLRECYNLPAKDINTSLGLHGCEFKRLCNCIGYDNINIDELNRVLLNYAELEKQFCYNTYNLSYNERIALLKRYENVNRQIASEYLNRIGKPLFSDYPKDINEPNGKYQGLTEEKIMEIATFIKKKKPELMRNLSKSISISLNSQTDIIKKAANILKPLLNICN